MDLNTLSWLQSPPGTLALARASGLELSAASLLRDVETLRREYSPEQARALAEQARLRRRAAAKFPQAEVMFFEAQALEQSTSWPLAIHRAARLPPEALVADLGCGLGGDALALATRGPVLAIDRDPLRLALATANARALGLDHLIHIEQRDLLAAGPPPADLLFCDPGRRTDGHRIRNSQEYQPPLSLVLSWQAVCPALVLKLAPGIDHEALPPTAELEFVSRDGELKEAVAWLGPLASTSRRATLLAGAPPVLHTLLAAQAPAPPLSPPLAYLYDPDPAVTRAGLVAELAQVLGAAQLDPTIAYLTASTLLPTPFARAWPIIEWLPWGLKRLQQRLRALGAGAVTVKKRGSPLDTDALARQLRGPGTQPLVVVLTRLQTQPIALICYEPVSSIPSLPQ